MFDPFNMTGWQFTLRKTNGDGFIYHSLADIEGDILTFNLKTILLVLMFPLFFLLPISLYSSYYSFNNKMSGK